MAYIILAAGFIVAVVITYATWVERERYLNLKALDPHLEKLALLVHRVEVDAGAPEDVKALARMAADHVFDQKAMTEIVVAAHRSSTGKSDLPKQLRNRYGAEYGKLAHEILHCFALICMFSSDFRVARMLRGKLPTMVPVPAPLRRSAVPSPHEQKQVRRKYVASAFVWAAHAEAA